MTALGLTRLVTIVFLTASAAALQGCRETEPPTAPASSIAEEATARAASASAPRVTAGNQFTCGVTTADVAYCWDMNTYGRLGLGSDAGPESCFTGDGFQPCSTKPARVVRGLAFRQVSAGAEFACGVTTEDVAYCWGINNSG